LKKVGTHGTTYGASTTKLFTTVVGLVVLLIFTSCLEVGLLNI
jgi:hypothetical protein